MPISYPDSGHRVRVHQSTYVHHATDGTETVVAIGADGERWYRDADKGGRMILPALPNRSHGRYWIEALVLDPSPRRAYRRLHDSWMLPDPHPAYVDEHGIRPGSRREFREYGYNTEDTIGIVEAMWGDLMEPQPVFDPKED